MLCLLDSFSDFFLWTLELLHLLSLESLWIGVCITIIKQMDLGDQRPQKQGQSNQHSQLSISQLQAELTLHIE